MSLYGGRLGEAEVLGHFGCDAAVYALGEELFEFEDRVGDQFPEDSELTRLSSASHLFRRHGGHFGVL